MISTTISPMVTTFVDTPDLPFEKEESCQSTYRYPAGIGLGWSFRPAQPTQMFAIWFCCRKIRIFECSRLQKKAID
jgi:hypothetical protein